MRSLNLKSTVNALVSFSNDRDGSLVNYARDLVRSCFLPQLRSIRAHIQFWQMRQRWMVQPAFAFAAFTAGSPVTAKPVNVTGTTRPVTG